MIRKVVYEFDSVEELRDFEGEKHNNDKPKEKENIIYPLVRKKYARNYLPTKEQVNDEIATKRGWHGWTIDHLVYIIDHPKESIEDTARVLGRSLGSVYGMKAKLETGTHLSKKTRKMLRKIKKMKGKDIPLEQITDSPTKTYLKRSRYFAWNSTRMKWAQERASMLMTTGKFKTHREALRVAIHEHKQKFGGYRNGNKVS